MMWFWTNIFGPGGMAIKAFPTQADRIAFVATKEYRAIFDLIEDLREKQGDPEPQPLEELTNPAGKILLRVPRSLHAALIAEAESEGVSVNQLILAKLAAQLRAVV